MGPHGTVLSIHRYPLKGAGGQQLRSIEAQTGGLALDRAWACIDDDGMVGSLKQPALWHGLTSVRVEGPESGDVPVEVFLDDWSGEIEAEVTRDRLSAHLGRNVHVSRKSHSTGDVPPTTAPQPRCVVPAVTADRHALDRDVLATLARHHRQPVLDLGTASCFGVYATVLTPGVISAGMPVT